MKNFGTRKRFPAPVVPALAAIAALLSSACGRVEQPATALLEPETVNMEIPGISTESIARMLADLPLSVLQVKEVFNGVSSSSSNGYDEEYPFSNLVLCPGSGVGDEMLLTKSAPECSEPLRDMILSAVSDNQATRSESSFLESLSDSGLQIYWPYSEDWDGTSLPVITFNPEDAGGYSDTEDEVGSNVGFLRETHLDGSWIVKEVIVDEEYAKNHPVWVINRNEDSGYMTPQMVEALYPEQSPSVATRSCEDFRTLVLKEFKAHRNYDSWLAGGSEFFVKCGSLEGFTAKTEDELKLFSPSVTDLMINVKRKQVGRTLRFNTLLVSEWTSQLDECVFLMTEDDGGKRTSWKATGVVKIKSKSYGFEVELPLNRNDDLVWRGKLSSSYFEKNNGSPHRLGDVSVTFSFL